MLFKGYSFKDVGALGLGQRTKLREVLSEKVSQVVWRRISPFPLELEKPNLLVQPPVRKGGGKKGLRCLLLTLLIGRNNLVHPMGAQICNGGN